MVLRGVLALSLATTLPYPTEPPLCGSASVVIAQLDRYDEVYQSDALFLGKPLYYFKNDLTGTWTLIWMLEPRVACIMAMGRDERPRT